MIKVDLERCDLCGTCVAVCPPDCIELREHILYIVEELCTECGACVLVCPMQALQNLPAGEK